MKFRVSFNTDDPEVIRMMKAPGRSETIVRALKSHKMLSHMDDRLAEIQRGMNVLLSTGTQAVSENRPGDSERTDGAVSSKIDRLMERLGQM